MVSDRINCRLQVCGNGCVHIQLGFITINLDKDDFLEFSSMVQKAVTEIAPPRENVSSLDKFKLLKGLRHRD